MLSESIRCTLFLVSITATTAFGQFRYASVGDGHLVPLFLASFALPFNPYYQSNSEVFNNYQVINNSLASAELNGGSCLVISCPLINAGSPETQAKSLTPTGVQKGNLRVGSLSVCFNGRSDGTDDEDPEKSGQRLTPVESIICPICHEVVSEEEDEVTSCCNRLFHARCLADYCVLSATPLVCPWCRAEPWYRDENYLFCLITKYHFLRQSTSVHSRRNRPRPWRCAHCRSSFGDEANLNTHLRKRHSYCWFCPVSVGNDFNIEQHNLNHDFHYMCFQCHWATAQTYALYQHITRDHHFRSPRHDCTCFGERISYRHMRQQGLFHYTCSLCNYISHYYHQHSQHMQAHQLYVCLHCNGRFESCSELQVHSRGCPVYDVMRY